MSQKVKLFYSILILFFSALDVAFSLDTQSFKPLNYGQGAFSVYSARDFRPGRWSFGVHYNLEKHPLEFGDVFNEKVDDVQEELYTANLILNYEISNRISLNINSPYHYLSNFEETGQGQSTKEEGQGDILLSLPFLVGLTERGWGFKIIPTVIFATGREEFFLGNIEDVFELTTVISKFNKRSSWHLNLGYQHKEREENFNLETYHSLIAGLSYINDIGRSNGFVWINELKAEMPAGSVAQVEVNSPAEFLIGFRHISNNQNFIWNIGCSRGLNHGYSSPEYRVFAGMNFSLPLQRESEESIEVPSEKNNEAEFSIIPEETLISEETFKPLVVYLDEIRFPEGSFSVKVESYVVLNKIVELLKKYKGIIKLGVYGHTDSLGSRVKNIKLSEKRAEAVVQYLVRQGVESRRLGYKGYGPDRPRASNQTFEGRRKNRRVEFKVVSNSEDKIIFKNKK